MELPKLFMYISFGWWAIATAIFLIVSVVFPQKYHERKINLRKPYDMLLVSIGLAWLSMWCFRSMY